MYTLLNAKKMLVNTTTAKEVQMTLLGTVAHKKAGVAAGFHGAMLFGLATMGIGVAISIGTMLWAMGEADKQISKLDQDMKKLSNSFMSGKGSATSFYKELGPHSVAGSAKYAREELELLQRTMINIPDIGERDIVINQVLNPFDIPDIEDITQVVTRKLVTTDIEEPESLTQTIIQQLVPDPSLHINPEPLTQEVHRKIVMEQEGIAHDIEEVQTINMKIPDSGFKGNVYVNIAFPNLIIREEADIEKISKTIEEVFQKQYYSYGGGD